MQAKICALQIYMKSAIDAGNRQRPPCK